MALIACKDCKKEFSTDASRCPHCGANSPDYSPKYAFITFLMNNFIIVVLIIGLVAYCGSDKKGSDNGSGKDKNIYTTELVSCYRQHLLTSDAIKMRTINNDLSFIQSPLACNKIRNDWNNYCLDVGQEKKLEQCVNASLMLWIVVNPPEMLEIVGVIRDAMKNP